MPYARTWKDQAVWSDAGRYMLWPLASLKGTETRRVRQGRYPHAAASKHGRGTEAKPPAT